MEKSSTHKPNLEWLELPSQFILLAVMVIAPWLYGSVHESVQFWLLIGVGAALGWYLLASLLRLFSCPALPVAMWPLMLALMLGFAQLIPLPRAIVAIVSPQAVQLRKELLPTDSSPDASLDRKLNQVKSTDHQTISLRPRSTRQDLTLLVLAVATFYLGTQLFLRIGAQFWVFVVLTVNGTALAFFGLIQKLTWNGYLFWFGAAPSGGGAFASFVNRNNAGGYLNLCAAVAIGLTIWTLSRRKAERQTPGIGKAVRRRVVRFLAQLHPRQLATFCMLVVVLGGVLSTFSRGAGIAMLGAAVITGLAMSLIPQLRRQIGWFVVVGILGLALVAWVGMSEGMQDRWDTLSDPEKLSEAGRLPNWKDAARAIPEFWQTGVGLGGYRDAYLMYQNRFAPFWYYHAENQYLEAIVDAGLIGLLLMLSVIVLVTIACWRLLRKNKGPAEEAIAITTVFALSSQAIHGIFDFGLYLPPNAMLLAVLCGGVTGAARPGASRQTDRKNAGYAWLVGLILLASLYYAAIEKRDIATTAPALAATDFTSAPGSATETQVRDGVERLTSLAELFPDDAELHYQLAKQNILLYRLRELSRLRQEMDATVGLDQLWKQTSPQALHLRAHQLAREGKSDELVRWQQSPAIQTHLVPALKQLLEARNAAPLLSKCHLRIAWLCAVADDPDHDQIHLARALRANPSSTHLLAEAGLLDIQAGRRESACRHWQQCLTYDLTYLDEVLEDAEPWFDFSTVVSQVLPQTPRKLLDVINRRFLSVADEERRAILLEHTKRQIEESDLADSDKAALRGRMLNYSGELTMAIREYLDAVQQEPNNALWRFELAKLLLGKGMLNEARKQTERCIRLDANNRRYEQLLKQIMQKLNG